MSNETKGYNGWTNYETWCVHLWMTNEESSYRYWRRMARVHLAEARECVTDLRGFLSVEKAAGYSLGEDMKLSFESNHPFRGDHLDEPREADVYGDLLDSALSEVQWSDVAEAFLEDL